MKITPQQWCKIQGLLAKLSCPQCYGVKVKLTEDEAKNAECKDCGCKFEFNPDVAHHQVA